MAGKLDGKRVAIVATDGFEQSELTEPRRALEAAGARTEIVSLRAGKIRGWKSREWGDAFEVLPGGVMNPDKLRMDSDAVSFVRKFFDDRKPVGAICHGPWTLIDAGVVKGRQMTSYPSLRQDLINAGARWTDAEVVTDKGLVTSRRPDDLPAFNAKLVEEIAEGAHAHAGAD